jgi:hypothetical protein
MVEFIMKGITRFQTNDLPPKVRGAFRGFGFQFEFDTRSEPHRLLFDEKKLRGSAGFQELWSIDFPLDPLSRRRCTARFGCIIRPKSNDLT